MPRPARRALGLVSVVLLASAVVPPVSSALAAPAAPVHFAPVRTGSRVAARTLAAAAPTWHAQVLSAAGIRQWIECAGSGSPTIVVIPGLHATHTMWSKVLPTLATTSRTCIYDRPGLGPSPARSPHRTVDAGLHARELMALLVAAHVTGPLVVIGHSYGGLIARAFAARYRSRVAGLVLVEGVAPYDRLSRYWYEGGDRVDTTASSAAALPMRLGSIPLVVLSAQDPDRNYWGGPAYGASAADIADWRAHQRAAASLSTQSTFLIVRHSAHVIEHDRPDAVIAAVRLLVKAIRNHTRLPRCAMKAYGAQPLCQ